ncbi:MAG TPA: hypothetical protein VHS99_17755 [Chloroflexota bacterium]|jgi:hypothetical protein|nr:hypothetical protein [Chloroflexota bacterium]
MSARETDGNRETERGAEVRLRRLVAGLGAGSVVFGVAPALAPRFFARLFGLDAVTPAAAVAVRSVGVRDAVLGLGLWAVAVQGGYYLPWLLARLVCDAGDTLAVALAVRAGARQPRFLALGGLALGAATTGAYLFRAARHLSAPPAAGHAAAGDAFQDIFQDAFEEGQR